MKNAYGVYLTAIIGVLQSYKDRGLPVNAQVFEHVKNDQIENAHDRDVDEIKRITYDAVGGDERWGDDNKRAEEAR